MEPATHIRLRSHPEENGAAYLELAAYPALAAHLAGKSEAGNIARSIDIHRLIDDYDGPRLCLDLDKDGRPIGIEILYTSGDDDESEDS